MRATTVFRIFQRRGGGNSNFSGTPFVRREEEGVDVEIATFTKAAAHRYRSLPTTLRVVHVCPRVYVLVIALLERATLYLDKRRGARGGWTGGSISRLDAKRRSFSLNRDRFTLVANSSKRVNPLWTHYYSETIVSPFICLIIHLMLEPFRQERQSLIVDRCWTVMTSLHWIRCEFSPDELFNWVSCQQDFFEFSARTIVREIDLLSVQWNEFAMARQGNNKDWGERIFGLEDEGCLVEKY